ncbi:hypothetical protein ATANTOWER_021275, partial [Ataeniobius toweri]|nr:hypothetical protein [Ataeniobius toweri]
EHTSIPAAAQLQDQRPAKSHSHHYRATASNHKQILLGKLNVAVLAVHWTQLCASLTMEGRVKQAQRQLAAQQDLLSYLSKLRPIQKEERIYGNWMDTMTTICNEIETESQILSDEAAEAVYQMRRASSISSIGSNYRAGNQKETLVKKKAMQAM